MKFRCPMRVILHFVWRSCQAFEQDIRRQMFRSVFMLRTEFWVDFPRKVLGCDSVNITIVDSLKRALGAGVSRACSSHMHEDHVNTHPQNGSKARTQRRGHPGPKEASRGTVAPSPDSPRRPTKGGRLPSGPRDKWTSARTHAGSPEPAGALRSWAACTAFGVVRCTAANRTHGASPLAGAPSSRAHSPLHRA
ncbi:uncharacterized protein [Dermacentor albipictus]|uniref:uncharacterized protein n=1 Tax=Dermacentor albipictus TaxID=60249 RepID=UPI0031FC0D92